MDNNQTGKRGEDVAAEYLRNKGYVIQATNWRFRHLELDIVALDKKTLVVAEIKTRHYPMVEPPQDAVTRQKQRNTIEATNKYIEKFNIDADVRFDIITVVFRNGSVTIEHIEDAFYPTLR